MLISKLGEFGLIAKFRRQIKGDASVIKGPGDDCAVLKFNSANYLLFTCDMLVEGVDFRKKEDPYLVGRKAAAVSVSDIAACCGSPRYMVASVGLPRKASVNYADKLFKGMLELCKEYRVNIVGGDLSRAEKLVIDVSMLGMVKKKDLVLRGGARKSDVIFTTGRLGGSIKGKHLRFTPRVKEAEFLIKNFKINSMIDISDGLAQDLGHILEESKAGALLYEQLIPLSKEARSLRDGLFMGEDFELLFTMPPGDAGKLLRRKDPLFSPIGEIVDRSRGLKLIDKNGKVKTLAVKGFRHF